MCTRGVKVFGATLPVYASARGECMSLLGHWLFTHALVFVRSPLSAAKYSFMIVPSSSTAARFYAKIAPGENENAEAELNRVFTKESFAKVSVLPAPHGAVSCYFRCGSGRMRAPLTITLKTRLRVCCGSLRDPVMFGQRMCPRTFRKHTLFCVDSRDR